MNGSAEPDIFWTQAGRQGDGGLDTPPHGVAAQRLRHRVGSTSSMQQGRKNMQVWEPNMQQGRKNRSILKKVLRWNLLLWRQN
jgi:hypothetical protein